MNGFVREETIARARHDVASQQSGAPCRASEPWQTPATRPRAEKAQHAVALAKKGLRAAEADQAAARWQRSPRTSLVMHRRRRSRRAQADPRCRTAGSETRSTPGRSRPPQGRARRSRSQERGQAARQAQSSAGRHRDAAQAGTRGCRGRSQVERAKTHRTMHR